MRRSLPRAAGLDLAAGRRLRQANRRLRRAIRRLSEEAGDSAEFVLSNAPPMPKPWRGGAPENTRQTVLVAGMDCVAGQQDLFEADGEAARTFRIAHGADAEVDEARELGDGGCDLRPYTLVE